MAFIASLVITFPAINSSHSYAFFHRMVFCFPGPTDSWNDLLMCTLVRVKKIIQFLHKSLIISLSWLGNKLLNEPVCGWFEVYLTGFFLNNHKIPIIRYIKVPYSIRYGFISSEFDRMKQDKLQSLTSDC
jgi:hypothetical protein